MFLGDLAQLTAGFDPVFARWDIEVEEIQGRSETLRGHDVEDFEDVSEAITS
jgi:hypothetical protein